MMNPFFLINKKVIKGIKLSLDKADFSGQITADVQHRKQKGSNTA